MLAFLTYNTEKKMPIIIGLPTNAALTVVEFKIPGIIV